MTKKKITKGAVSFIIRKDKTNADGKAPLMLSYSLFGQRQRLSLEREFKKDIKIHPYQFDVKNNRAVYFNRTEAKRIHKEYYRDLAAMIPFDYNRNFFTQHEADEYNSKLDELIRMVRGCEDYFEANQMTYTSTDVINQLKSMLKGGTLATKEDKKLYVVDYIKSQIAITEATANRNTLKAQKTMLNHLETFERTMKQRTPVESVGRHFMQSFYNWLIGKGHLNGTAQTQIVKLKSFLNLARKDGYQTDLTYKDFTVKSTQMEVIALTYDEFVAIRDLDLFGDGYTKIQYGGEWVQVGYKTLNKARDLFVFGCLTGLRYSDIDNLKHENIKDGYLSLTVVKTKQKLEVPLVGMAYDILAKYENPLRPLPEMSNQKLNLYIKEVARLAGINEPTEIIRYSGSKEVRHVAPKHELISAHTARKSFITVSLELGMTAEEVMKVSGHSTYKSFKRYVNVTKERTRKAMSSAWEQPRLRIVSGGVE
ncbi:MAG TPA: phage integrase SAM-like domain-containing protein [Parapedobacter sp.]|uniref:site-specific integrase n=1 Tax=Parapedobacter sp. TaxID=1958893 RepID=UPI002CEFA448|nr:phage integrase SAM-like domain-containing protein [Parapedobacter sp.]HWK59260.1 phage integrase SAM-like domain-containing protein [Parapedobacter sp.]